MAIEMTRTAADLAGIMPFSPEAEQSVLGAILLDPSCMDRVAELLPRPEYFHQMNNALIYRVMMEKELILETMVKSLGFSDAVVAVSSESNNVNVFINSAELNYDTALSIYSMMKNETGIVAGNVIIMPVYAES